MAANNSIPSCPQTVKGPQTKAAADESQGKNGRHAGPLAVSHVGQQIEHRILLRQAGEKRRAVDMPTTHSIPYRVGKQRAVLAR